MNRFPRLLYILLLAASSASMCYGDALITIEQAQQSVRSDEGDPTIQFQNTDLEENTGTTSWAHPTYCLVRDDSSGTTSWTVDALTGEVLSAIYHEAFPDEESSLPLGPRSQEECKAIALTVAQSRFQEFATMDFVLDDEKWDGDGWAFAWRQKLANDALTMNFVKVDINPVTGAVESYVALRTPTPVAYYPLVSPIAATTIAYAACGIVSGQLVRGPVLMADPDRTYYAVRVRGCNAEGYSLGCVAEISAMDGSVFNLYYEAGGSARSVPACTHKSVKVGFRTLLSAMGYTIFWYPEKQSARAVRGGSEIVVRAATCKATVNGKAVVLSEAPRLVSGRMLVPSSLAAVIGRK